MWQNKIKDMDLILIALQAVLRALKYTEKKQPIKDLGLESLDDEIILAALQKFKGHS